MTGSTSAGLRTGRHNFRAMAGAVAVARPDKVSVFRFGNPPTVRHTKINVCDPEVFGGTAVKTLTDHQQSGRLIDALLDDIPTVRCEPVIAFLEEARERVIAAPA